MIVKQVANDQVRVLVWLIVLACTWQLFDLLVCGSRSKKYGALTKEDEECVRVKPMDIREHWPGWCLL